MKLKDEERRAKINSQVEKVRVRIEKLHAMLQKERNRLSKLELELINRTATVQAMPAARLPDQAYPSNDDSETDLEALDLSWEKEDGEIQ